MHEACEAVAQYLCKHPEITAVVSLNDYTMGYLLVALEQAGLKVPEEISVVGFDNTGFTDAQSELNRPLNYRPTTIAVPLRQIGQETARLLLQSITHPDTINRTVMLPVTFVEGTTTAPPGRRA